MILPPVSNIKNETSSIVHNKGSDVSGWAFFFLNHLRNIYWGLIQLWDPSSQMNKYEGLTTDQPFEMSSERSLYHIHCFSTKVSLGKIKPHFQEVSYRLVVDRGGRWGVGKMSEDAQRIQTSSYKWVLGMECILWWLYLTILYRTFGSC